MACALPAEQTIRGRGMKADEIRITKYGIRKGDYYCPCVYTMNNDGSVTVYARRYDRHIPRELGFGYDVVHWHFCD